RHGIRDDRDTHCALPGSPAHTHAGRLVPASRPPSPPARKSNPHSARGTAGAKLPATSCLGAFWTPAARARGISSLPASKNLHRSGLVRRSEDARSITSEALASNGALCLRPILPPGCSRVGRTVILLRLHRQGQPNRDCHALVHPLTHCLDG